MASLNNTHDEKLRFISQDANFTEKNMYKLRRVLEGYVRNQERLRKKALKLALTLKSFGEQEAPQLGGFLQYMSEAVQQREIIREDVITRMTISCVEPLKYYHILCNKLKQEVRMRESALGKEVRRHNNMDKVLIRDGQNRSRLTQTQLELVSAAQELHHVTNSLMQSVERFEQQKRNDMRQALGQFLEGEITYHAKALEIMTDVNKMLNNVDLEADIVELTERINAASSRPGSPTSSLHVNMPDSAVNGFAGYGGYSPMKSPLKTPSGTYSPTPTTLNYNYLQPSSPNRSPLKSALKMKSPDRARSDSKIPPSPGYHRRSRSSMR